MTEEKRKFRTVPEILKAYMPRYFEMQRAQEEEEESFEGQEIAEEVLRRFREKMVALGEQTKD